MTEPQDPYTAPDQPSVPPPAGSYPPPPPPLPASAYGQPMPGQGGKTNTLAIIALVAAFLCAPAGIIMGFISKSQIKQRGEGGSGLATAAIVIGFVVLAINITVVASGGFGGGSTGRGY